MLKFAGYTMFAAVVVATAVGLLFAMLLKEIIESIVRNWNEKGAH